MRVDDRTTDFGMKKGGKLVFSGRTVYSADGKTRTLTYSGTNAQGQKFNNTAVYVRH